jgi:hypothetical protein
MSQPYAGQPESRRFVTALSRALDQLGPIRTLELVGDTFLSQVGPREKAYSDAVIHVGNAMYEFERREPLPTEPLHKSDQLKGRVPSASQDAKKCSCHIGSICGSACDEGKHHSGCPHEVRS